MPHSTVPFQIDDEIRLLRRFHQLTEDQLHAANLAEAKMLHATFKVDSTLEASFLLYENSPENSDLNFFPKKLRYSIVIHLFTIFETYASELCDEIAYFYPHHTLRLSDLSGSTTERVKRYFTTYTRILAREAPEWETIVWIEKFRHVIVHSNGIVPSEKAGRFYESLRDRKIGLFIDNGRYLYLSRELVAKLIDGLQAWFRTAISKASLDEERANKAPEPTPLPVTPPAEPGVAPGSGVAHL